MPPWHKARTYRAPMRLHTTTLICIVKRMSLIAGTILTSVDFNCYPFSKNACYNDFMKVILMAIGGVILLMIINSFLGGNPLG